MSHTIELHDRKDYWDLHVFHEKGKTHASVLIGKGWTTSEVADAIGFLARNLKKTDVRSKSGSKKKEKNSGKEKKDAR